MKAALVSGYLFEIVSLRSKLSLEMAARFHIGNKPHLIVLHAQSRFELVESWVWGNVISLRAGLNLPWYPV